jgi:hypothetical protein
LVETPELIQIDRALVNERDLHDFLLAGGSVAGKKRLVSQRQTVVRLRGNLVGLEPIHPARVADDGLPSGLLYGCFRRRSGEDPREPVYAAWYARIVMA